jgi:hypothetical protein
MSKREVVGYVVREGKERGKGRYYRANGDWEISQRFAKRYPHNPRAGFGDQYRVVALVKRAPVRLVATEEDALRYEKVFYAHQGNTTSMRLAGIQAVFDGRAKELGGSRRLRRRVPTVAGERAPHEPAFLQPGGGSEEPENVRILRADIQRMTEQRDALREQAQGLAEKLDAVRKAAS